MTFGKLAKDFQSTLRSIRSFTAGQAHIIDWDSDKLTWLKVQLRPGDGPYEGGMFDFMIVLPKRYPREPPNVTCLTTIFHPNIDPDCEEYNVCLSLFDEWQETFNLEDVIQGLLFLMKNPNLEDPLSSYFDPSMDEDEYLSMVRQSLRGENIEDISLSFERVLCEDIEGEGCGETSGRVANDNSEQDNEGAKANCDNAQLDTTKLDVTLCVTDMVETVTLETESVFDLRGLFDTDTTESLTTDDVCLEEFSWEQPIVFDEDAENVNECVTSVTECVTEDSLDKEFGWEQVIVLDDEDDVNLKTDQPCEDEDKTKPRPVIQPASYYEAKRLEMLKQMDNVVKGLTDKDFVGDDEDEEDEDQCDQDEEEEEEWAEEGEVVPCENVDQDNAANGLSRQVSKLERAELIQGAEGTWMLGEVESIRRCTFMDPQLDGPVTYLASLAVAYIWHRLL